MLKRLVGVVFEAIAVVLMMYIVFSVQNYRLTHNIVKADIVGVADGCAYVVYDGATIVIENVYKLSVGDKLIVHYDEGSKQLVLLEVGKYFSAFIVGIFAAVVGVLLLLDYNTYLTIATIVVYVINYFIIAGYSEGILVIKPFGAVCNYCKPILNWLIVLNTILLLGYFLNFVISFLKAKRTLMLQSEKLT